MSRLAQACIWGKGRETGQAAQMWVGARRKRKMGQAISGGPGGVWGRWETAVLEPIGAIQASKTGILGGVLIIWQAVGFEMRERQAGCGATREQPQQRAGDRVGGEKLW